MNLVAADPLERLIRESGEGWLIDWYAPREKALPHFRELLRRADEIAQERLGGSGPRLTLESLIEMSAQNPHKVRGFLQVMGSGASPHILLMVWRILQGMGIAAIRMHYDADGAFHLYVKLASHNVGEVPEEEYESDNIDDSAVLRHLGRVQMENRAVFDGFYGLNLKRTGQDTSQQSHQG